MQGRADMMWRNLRKRTRRTCAKTHIQPVLSPKRCRRQQPERKQWRRPICARAFFLHLKRLRTGLLLCPCCTSPLLPRAANGSAPHRRRQPSGAGGVMRAPSWVSPLVELSPQQVTPQQLRAAQLWRRSTPSLSKLHAIAAWLTEVRPGVILAL